MGLSLSRREIGRERREDGARRKIIARRHRPPRPRDQPLACEWLKNKGSVSLG
jgi:hypothetical protein